MAEQAENLLPQQPPFTEKGLAKMNEWIAGNPDFKQLSQPNINRLFLLKNLRQIGCNMGFREEVEPEYTIENNKDSDVLMGWDTITNGFLKLKLQLDNLTTTIQTQHEEADLDYYASFKNELIGIKNQLKENGINTPPTFIDVKDNVINLPEKEIKRGTIVEPELPPKVPLKDQELSLDVHAGTYYGSPKKK